MTPERIERDPEGLAGAHPQARLAAFSLQLLARQCVCLTECRHKKK